MFKKNFERCKYFNECANKLTNEEILLCQWPYFHLLKKINEEQKVVIMLKDPVQFAKFTAL